MKRIGLCFVCLAYLFISADIYSQVPADKEESTAAEKSLDITRIIIGEWTLAPNKRMTGGSILFTGDGSYEMNETLHDGTGVGKKGEYRLFTESEPVRIKLCLDKCGKPGGEWTTTFGIIRLLDEGKLEICSSPEGKFPSDFPEDPASSEYSMVLTRAE